MRSFIMSHFSNWPLIWMFYDRATNDRINKIHEKTSLILCWGIESSFDELLAIYDSVSIHQRNLQWLMIEICKTKKKLNPSLMEDIFFEKPNTHNLRNNDGLIVPKTNTSHGIETIRYIDSRPWQSLPCEVKESRNLQVFKKRIGNWKTDRCNCRLCKTFIEDLGYI